MYHTKFSKYPLRKPFVVVVVGGGGGVVVVACVRAFERAEVPSPGPPCVYPGYYMCARAPVRVCVRARVCVCALARPTSKFINRNGHRIF